MTMGETKECVIDTMILQKANAPLTRPPRERSFFRVRVGILNRILRGRLTVLVSAKLIVEYRKQVPSPRNDHIKAFFELLERGHRGSVILNWKKRWSGSDREKARGCRYPKEDDHVLRTAIRPSASYIVTEENRMLKSNMCIYRRFRVHIVHPRSVQCHQGDL
jgi:predicted nucleic acid-binding protein